MAGPNAEFPYLFFIYLLLASDKHNTLNQCCFNVGSALKLYGSNNHDTGGRGDSHTGHMSLRERTYGERHVI